MTLTVLATFAILAALVAPVAAEPIAIDEKGCLCLTFKYGDVERHYDACGGLTPDATEKQKKSVVDSYREMFFTEVRVIEMITKASFQTEWDKRGRPTLWGGGGGGTSYRGKRQDSLTCIICQASECNSECWNKPGFPPCPPPC